MPPSSEATLLTGQPITLLRWTTWPEPSMREVSLRSHWLGTGTTIDLLCGQEIVRELEVSGSDLQLILQLEDGPTMSLMSQTLKLLHTSIFFLIIWNCIWVSFELQGDPQGSQGASSYFVGRVVVMGDKNKFYNMEMSSALNGQASVVAKSSDSQIMLVIASVPEFFGGWQTYGYQVKITRNWYWIFQTIWDWQSFQVALYIWC